VQVALACFGVDDPGAEAAAQIKNDMEAVRQNVTRQTAPDIVVAGHRSLSAWAGHIRQTSVESCPLRLRRVAVPRLPPGRCPSAGAAATLPTRAGPPDLGRMPPGGAVTFFELADPGFSVTSDEVHRAREECWYARTSYGLAVLRHDQASRLIRHPGLRQARSAGAARHGITSGPLADWWAGWVLNKEGADHRRLRKLLNPAFSRRLVEAMRPRFRALAAELVDSFAGTGRCEFMADFAEPYAARVIAHMLG